MNRANKLVGEYYSYIADENYKNSSQMASTLKFCYLVFVVTLPIIVMGLIMIK